MPLASPPPQHALADVAPQRFEIARCLAQALAHYAHWLDRNLRLLNDDTLACRADRERLRHRARSAEALAPRAGELLESFALLRRSRACVARPDAELQAAIDRLLDGWPAAALEIAATACAVQHDQTAAITALGEALLVEDPSIARELDAELTLIAWTRAWLAQAACAITLLAELPRLSGADDTLRQRWKTKAGLAFEPTEPLREGDDSAVAT